MSIIRLDFEFSCNIENSPSYSSHLNSNKINTKIKFEIYMYWWDSKLIFIFILISKFFLVNFDINLIIIYKIMLNRRINSERNVSRFRDDNEKEKKLSSILQS